MIKVMLLEHSTILAWKPEDILRGSRKILEDERGATNSYYTIKGAH